MAAHRCRALLLPKHNGHHSEAVLLLLLGDINNNIGFTYGTSLYHLIQGWPAHMSVSCPSHFGGLAVTRGLLVCQVLSFFLGFLLSCELSPKTK